ncbi:unnamed protein product [Fusarium venenatum]|uniref:Uncharacterized protein n=1 Tax=Fusarium venenatum TaxID=56646 RepID=A0A2L2SN94_9HYPO|nr:uncharacterized protein FVRRES_11617 [Fusarium venenatum]CEI38926.1 unnamed protein product [Fusarium venenatum]
MHPIGICEVAAKPLKNSIIDPSQADSTQREATNRRSAGITSAGCRASTQQGDEAIRDSLFPLPLIQQ